MDPAPALLFYDRDCRFCAWGVVGLAARARPGALRLATIQGPLGDEHLGHLDPEARLASWHLWDGERLRSEADVLDGLAPRVAAPGLRLALAAGRIVPRPLATVAYRQVAGHRIALSRLVPAGAKRRAQERLPPYLADGET
ncbi:DCC1-like thiol-disulfide oxidoreductase family protein [Patulibacter americanus]|uniref:DCC1-like thiol-disulfide oxidoreductase family protein n=1 Tax=Patulibacter americanus TaxID=588672 RepID=UPI0003B4669A|nr:DCC1-like thiol-disulfide oxidoreductase family protein [Patulibacter americanus]